MTSPARQRARSASFNMTAKYVSGPDPDHEEVYEEVTGEMQDALDELADERTLPLVG